MAFSILLLCAEKIAELGLKHRALHIAVLNINFANLGSQTSSTPKTTCVKTNKELKKNVIFDF